MSRKKRKNGIRVRVAKPEDLPAVVEMGRSFFDASGFAAIGDYSPEAVADMLAGLIDGKAGTVLLANNGKPEPVGMIVLAMVPVYFSPGRFIASELAWWVDEEARSKGAGRKLLKAAEEWAKGAGAASVSMVALASNQGIAKKYLDAGYRLSESSYIKGL